MSEAKAEIKELHDSAKATKNKRKREKAKLKKKQQAASLAASANDEKIQEQQEGNYLISSLLLLFNLFAFCTALDKLGVTSIFAAQVSNLPAHLCFLSLFVVSIHCLFVFAF